MPSQVDAPVIPAVDVNGMCLEATNEVPIPYPPKGGVFHTSTKGELGTIANRKRGRETSS